MKLKHLKSILDDVDTFNSPNVHLEQYPTPPDIAAHVMHHVFSQGEIEGKLVADLGCGAGILSIGAAVLNAGHIVGFDIDAAALQICLQNCTEMDISTVDMIQWDLALTPDMRWKDAFDTVVMNPPFGTRTKGLDMVFLKAALFMSSGSVYSLHKTSTREHIKKKSEEWGVNCRVVAELRYNIDRLYTFHKRDSADVAVDFVHFSKRRVPGSL
ncbi:rRNA N(6)-adenosine-methyltransferase METTL5 isoform X2 [Dermacentor andersoni]|uniref:rRNA N(6)-adenosine-methyltransferase METTL5 isoform X2 n=1 Tax=Dermacentor andersoni TaxID=34620 RepID=UPI0021550B13|nr:rRNA N6-adenosine-methyltransferase METTL5-like [Dermacentor andersoni]